MPTKNSTEIWMPVVGYEGIYSVSAHGIVRRDAPGVRTFAGRIMVQRMDRYGYLIVCLTKNKNAKYIKVHRVVAAAFIGECPREKQVNHKNGIKTDNGVGNLEYVTVRENRRHAIEVLGQHHRGSENNSAKLTEDQVVAIRAAKDVTSISLARRFHVSKSLIGAIVRREIWKHI